MKTILIVDGYNVIHGDAELEDLSKIKLEEARERLIHLLAGYGGFKGIDIILVFDAYKHDSHFDREITMGKMTIVYTEKNKTADTYIEKLVFDLPRLYTVKVVTSDYTLQRMVLASGAIRIAARELMEEVRAMGQEVAASKDKRPERTKLQLQDFMDEQTLAKFKAMRTEE